MFSRESSLGFSSWCLYNNRVYILFSGLAKRSIDSFFVRRVGGAMVERGLPEMGVRLITIIVFIDLTSRQSKAKDKQFLIHSLSNCRIRNLYLNVRFSMINDIVISEFTILLGRKM